jgi:conjugative relaxase-like TrwC/TraI family protein
MAGRWGGKGAALLGLHGTITPEPFHQLCHNINPATGEPLTVRTRAYRRVGFDFNFNAPKSVSLAYEYTGDENILRVFLRAERETMEEIEKDASTRVRTDGADEDRKTGNFVWGDVTHFTARPKDGIPDPHLHGHVFCFNATLDPVENRWKAAQIGQIKANTPYYEAAFHARFSRYLRELGYGIELHGRYFELAGCPRSLNDKFSRRTKAIKDKAKELGITDAKDMDGLGALTREKKAKELSKTELHAIWWQRLTPEEKTILGSLKTRLLRSPEMQLSPDLARVPLKDFLGTSNTAIPVLDNTPFVVQPKNDREAVAFAIEHLFERKSVVTERELITEALQWGYGMATVEGVKNAAKDFPLIRVEKDGRTLLTTREVLAEEKRLIRECKNGKENYPPLHLDWQIQNEQLNEQQRAAVLSVMRSRDFITGIAGKAGTGKTTLLQEARKGIEAGGHKLFVFAPTSEAARVVLRKEGFENAETVALLLASKSLQEEARGAVWWVDEAGLLSARSMDKLVALAKKQGARLVLVGDVGQHHAVERGQAFDLLQKFGGLEVAGVDQIQRQKGHYKRAVEQIAAKDFDGAFQSLEKMESFEEIEDIALRHKTLAADYVRSIQFKNTVLVVSPTHAECKEVTQAIRQELKEKKLLGKGQEWNTLHNLSWTTAQKRDVKQYDPGHVIRMTRPTKLFKKGEQLEVVEVKHGVVRAKDRVGDLHNVPTWEPDAFNVYERQTLEICEGERIRITANGRSADNHALTTGSFYTVDYFAPDGKLVLDNGWRVGKEFPFLDHGVAATSHASQGKTVDWVFVAQSAEPSSGATDARQFYVSVSRGRKGVKIYTDDIEILRENVANVRERHMAMEVAPPEEKASKRLGEGKENTVLPSALPEIALPSQPETKSKELLGQENCAEKLVNILNAMEAMLERSETKKPVPQPEIVHEPEIEEIMELGM